MKEETKKYPEEFKKQIVELYENGKSVINLAREYGLVEQTIYKWIHRYETEEYLAELKIRHSYSRKGCPYDNSCIESFHSILKKEEVNLKKYKDFKDAYNAIFEFIEAWYNRERIHSCLNYRTPDEVYSNLEKSLVA